MLLGALALENMDDDIASDAKKHASPTTTKTHSTATVRIWNKGLNFSDTIWKGKRQKYSLAPI